MPDALLSQRVYTDILNQLMRKRLRPGDLLSRRDVAKSIGVSGAPVRDAIQQLEADGFLVSKPRIGTMVRQIELEDVWGCLILREALEVQAARLYCGPPIVENKRRLLKLAKRIHSAGIPIRERWQLDIEFHFELVKLADCQPLLTSFENVMNHSMFHAVNRMTPPSPEVLNDPHFRQNHMALVEELSTAAPNRAAQVIYQHVHQRLRVTKKEFLLSQE